MGADGNGQAVPSALVAARAYVARGLTVFPLQYRDKVPATIHGVFDASDDDAQLEDWFWREHFTNLAIAIPEGVVVVDVDNQHGGQESLRDLVADYGWDWLTDVPRQRTGNGGFHSWFSYDGPPIRYKHPAYPGIELGQVGRYVVAAPSVHPNGTTYRWEVRLPDAVPTDLVH